MTLLPCFALSAALFLLPYRLVEVQGWTAFAAGLALLAGGPAIAAVGCATLALPGAGGQPIGFLVPVAIRGAGTALAGALDAAGVAPEVRAAMLQQTDRLAEALRPADIDAATAERTSHPADAATVSAFRGALALGAACAALAAALGRIVIRRTGAHVGTGPG